MADYSPEDLRRLEVLGRIIGTADARSMNQQAIPGDLLGSQLGASEMDELREHVRDLEGAGYVTVDWRLGGMWSARPTAQGRDRWEALEAARNNVRARRQQMRDDYLEWIVDQDDAGTYPTADDFLTTEPTYLGKPYTQADLEQTGRWLDEARYIKGPKVAQRPDPLRPAPTAKGRLTIEQGRSVNEAPRDETPGAPTFHNTFNAPANVAQNSHDVQQTINVGWQDQARELVDEISRRLDLVDDERARSELAATTDELRAEVAGDARPSVVRGIVAKLGIALTTAMASEAGNELAKQVFHLLQSLPA